MDSEAKRSVCEEPSFLYHASLMLQITGINDAILSLGAYEPIHAKELLSGTHVEWGRKPLEKHVEDVFSARETSGNPIAQNAPFLVVSVRNVLANMRCGAWVRGRTAGFITVNEESGVQTARPYHALAWRDDGFQMREVDVTREALDNYAWLFSGVPVLWDDMIFERMVTEAADHSHVFELPRGNHPKATDETRARWKRLHDVFCRTLSESRLGAYAELMKEADGLKRENGYWHNVLGIDARGEIQVYIGIGKLEALGERLKAAGARRAMMVDNGGSTSVSFYPDGIGGQRIALLEAPNHRRLGTAYLVIFLKSKGFESSPGL